MPSARPSSVKRARVATKGSSGSTTSKENTAADGLLDEALALLAEDRSVAALDRLLDAWGARRSKATADVIVELGKLLDRSLPPIDTTTKRKIVEETWLDIATSRRPADIPRLLEVLRWASAPVLKEWIAQLADFKADPRVAGPVVAAADRFTSSGAGPTRTAAGRLEAAIGYEPSLPLSPSGAALLARIKKELKRLARARPPTPEVLFAAPTTTSRRGRALKPAGVTDESLVAMVLAAPDDHGPRLVYGDWLSERGDPRAELITLQARGAQLTGKEKKRIAELIKTHGASWIRPLDSVVKSPRFELGFLSGCGEVAFRTEKQRQSLLEHPLWATVREMDACNEERLLLSDALRSLRVLETNAKVLAKVAAKATPVSLEEVRMNLSVKERASTREQLDAADLGHWNTIGDVGALKHLSRLRLAVLEGKYAHFKTREHGKEAAHFEWLLSSRLARQLELLEIDNEWFGVCLDGWIENGFKRLPKLETFVVQATPPFSTGGLSSGSGPGGKGFPGGPCPVRWVLTPHRSKPLRAELQVGNPYYQDRLRPIGTILAANLRNFPRKDLSEVTVRYIGKPIRPVELEKLHLDMKHLLSPSFRHVHRSDGTTTT